jgi:geranylgeranyl pyrophosphate synthase
LDLNINLSPLVGLLSLRIFLDILIYNLSSNLIPRDNWMSSKSPADIKRTFKERGGPAMKNVRKTFSQSKDESYTSQALLHLSKITLHNAVPVFPALVSMSYEAVGGKDEKAIPVGEAILLASFAADLHDDIIDKSISKGSKQTIYGKFGEATAILAGDILLVKGLKQLIDATQYLPKTQSEEMIQWVSDAVVEICNAEALQLKLINTSEVTPEQYYEVIRLKAVVPELCMKIGAALGTTDLISIKGLSEFGRIYGINSVIVEEFADLLDFNEFKNRLSNEIPPLPMLYALRNPTVKVKINGLLDAELNADIHEKIVGLVLECKEVDELHGLLVENAAVGQKQLPMDIDRKLREELEALLFVPLKYFES